MPGTPSTSAPGRKYMPLSLGTGPHQDQQAAQQGRTWRRASWGLSGPERAKSNGVCMLQSCSPELLPAEVGVLQRTC